MGSCLQDVLCHHTQWLPLVDLVDMGGQCTIGLALAANQLWICHFALAPALAPQPDPEHHVDPQPHLKPSSSPTHSPVPASNLA